MEFCHRESGNTEMDTELANLDLGCQKEVPESDLTFFRGNIRNGNSNCSANGRNTICLLPL